MSEGKRRKDSNRAALNKCWVEDIEWNLIPYTLREVRLEKGANVSLSLIDRLFVSHCPFNVLLAIKSMGIFSYDTKQIEYCTL